MGIIAGWFWRKGKPGRTRLVLHSLANTFIAIFLAMILCGEGSGCLLVVSPLLFACLLTGTIIGAWMRKMRYRRLNISFVVALLFLLLLDTFSRHNYQNKVSDTCIINAPPAKVWQNVVAFKRIQKKPQFWFFRIGLPYPVESTVTGYCKGAGRKCIFSNNYVFDEVISTYDVGKNLTFDITNQPKDPEIMRHIDIERGQFLLKDNGDGTTTLTGNSWYRLYVFPAWYYDLWAKSIVRNVHTRVMKHIKEISER